MSSKKQTEIQEVIAKNRPDYASLFGSVELCDCEHCRSIYSPAAYLVDLLQFLDPKIPGVTPLDVLIGNSNKKWLDGKPIVGRRPDLAHIQLSCENTNTTLPYVDLVNEVLESYIAFEQTLPLQKTDAGGAPLSPPVPLPNESSAGVTAAELAANPENTRDQAYEVLDAALYPFILPFNQPITALRLALEQMGTSRHEVMTVFGKKSDTAAGCARDVEALKIAEREFTVLTGEQFDGTPANQSVSDYYGFEMPMPPADTAWIAGAVPAGAQQHILNDTWAFAALNPPPDSGVLTHASMVTGGLHQHYFDKVPDAVKLTVEKEDILFSEIFLDPANLPQQIMLQWSDGTWEHRAYWGPSKTLIKLGVEGTPSCRYMGPLPEPGTWHRLEVPAFFVGLADRDLSGMAFTLFGGGATWGAAGKRSPSWVEWLTHVPTFLARAGVTYIELIELLRVRYINPARPQGEALSTFERMPISYGELSRLVGNNFADPSVQTLKALAGAGMTLNDAAAWAEEHFEPLSKLIVLDAPDSACDLALTRLQHLDGTLLEEAELHRLHRFLRLWRKIGWSMPDVDRAMVALQAPDITPTLLRQLGQIVQLQAILKLAPQQMLSFWGIIPVTGPDALYGKLFLNKAVRDIDPEFAPVEGEYLSAADLKINNHVPALLAGLRTRAADLVMIREHNGLAGDAAPLTLATATALYRYVTLARALKIAVKDLIALLTLSGERPFSALSDSNSGFNDIDPARTIRFVRLVERVKRSGFAPAVLSYLFSNQEDDPSNLSPGDASIDLLVSTIRDGLVRIATENIPVDDPIGEVTRTKLGLLFEAHIVEEITGLIAGTRIFTVPLTKLPAGVALPEGKVAYDEKDSHLLTAEGWLIDTEKAALLALSSDENYQKAINSLYNQPRELLHETLVNRLGWKTAEADLKTSVLEPTSFDADGNPDPKRVADKFKNFMAGALSHLRNALGRAFVKQTLADAMNLEPATAALLLEGANGVVPLGSDAERSLPAIADFLTLVGDGLTAAYFGNENWSGLSEIRLDPVVDFRWDARHGFSVRWEGTLLADRTQRYLFHLRAGGSATLTLDGNLLIEQQEDSMPVEYAEAVDLEAGRHYNLKLEYANHTAQALIELRWSGPAIPAEIVPSYRLYSTARRDVVTAAKHSCIRLHKASLIVGGSILTPREIAHLSHPDRADALHLNALPVGDDSADQRILFAAWTRWSDFAALRMAASANPAALLDVFTAATVEQAHTALVRAMGWDSAVFAELAGILENLDYKDPATLFEMVEAMRLWVKLGVPAAQVFRWATHAPTMQQARDAAQEAKRALKAKYDNEAWLEIARPLADRLRESQRSALVAYLLPRLGYTDPSQLFEHFLIDVEMSPCMQTSRIKQAISSVQIFVQRCRMNLEGPQVSPKMIDGSRWQWMQNYRVWEANLKVFLYPENWIEPELRDDKSPFFRELEAELLQAEVTTESAGSALGNYLEKLDTVSQLKICGLYEQTDFAADERRESVLHVFGHTFATPRSFYYRQLVTVNPNYRYWTAWEQVPLDIQADEVLPVIWNRRLYVFWKVITEKADMDTKTKYSVVRLAWSEYRQGKWTSKQLTPYKDSVAIASPAARMNVEIRGDELKIVFALMEGGAGSNPTVSTVGGAPTSKTASYIAIEKRFGSLRFLNYNGKVEPSEANTSKTYSRGFLEASSQDLQFLPVASPDQSIPVFARSANMIELYSPGSQPFTLNAYFFVQEGPRAYLVLPSSSEQSDIERRLTTEVQPFLAGAKASGPLAADKESGVALQASFAKLSAKANPWLSGRASIAATETRAVLKTDAAKPSGLSIAAEIFKHGVIHPGALYAPWYPAEFKFETFFHPYTAEFQRRLNRYGVPGLLNIESQKAASLPKVTSFKDAYDPDWMTVKTPWPAHDVDFTFTGAYSNYNWEVFFHVPLLIASRLSKNQRFEEAMRWFHYIFNPTAGTTADSVPQSYWNVLPLREAHSQRLDEMLKALNEGDADAVAQWEDLQAHPFQPHRVARLRRIAYQKTVVMKYIDNLIAWGDQLFHQDTIEKINQATQLYVLAAALLGPRVQRLPPRGRNIPRTYAQLRAGLDKFNQAMVSFENDLPFSSRATCGEVSTETTGLLGIGRSVYFCLPKNDTLLGYWDTVADRLFKIRHCMNIEGLVRELPLFEPPIDPALLVKAAAQGIDLSSVLSDLSAPLPHYRFNTLLAKGLEMTGELRSLGAALLAALEKRDAEHLASLRVSHETELLALVKQVKQQQLNEAQEAETALRKSREVTQTRFDFYNNIQQRIGEEINQLKELEEAQRHQSRAQTIEANGADTVKYIPDISVSVGMGASVSTTLGRGNIVPFYQALSRERQDQASIHTYQANQSSILGGWKRRADDWKLQKDLADKELAQIDKQITAASIRVAIAQQELGNTTRQIEQSQEIGEFLINKFSGEELYNWMVGELSALFFQSYQMAYDLAKQAERAYRFELGLTTSNLIRFGAWDSMRKGLLSGERLHLQLKQMESAYLDVNRREYEITKHYSLAQNDPLGLIRLREQGWCEIDLAETLFDLDFPGHYMRRIKSVSLTIPAIAGPYTGVNCTLTLLRDKTRVKSVVAAGYAERDGEEDDRFVTNWTRMQSIATSSAQSDSGVFELNYRDERYLPFEGGGVISRWRIELPRELRQFDYDTISDVVMHIRYTAREGGALLRDAATTYLKQQLEDEVGRPQLHLFSLRHDFPSEWQRLQTGTVTNGVHKQAFPLAKRLFRYPFQAGEISVNKVELFGVPKSRAKKDAPELAVTLVDPKEENVELKQAAPIGLLVHKSAGHQVEVQNPGLTNKEADWTLQVAGADRETSLDRLEDILVLYHYSVTMPTNR